MLCSRLSASCLVMCQPAYCFWSSCFCGFQRCMHMRYWWAALPIAAVLLRAIVGSGVPLGASLSGVHIAQPPADAGAAPGPLPGAGLAYLRRRSCRRAPGCAAGCAGLPVQRCKALCSSGHSRGLAQPMDVCMNNPALCMVHVVSCSGRLQPEPAPVCNLLLTKRASFSFPFLCTFNVELPCVP